MKYTFGVGYNFKNKDSKKTKKMEWIPYKEKKPTNKNALYLIEYGWHPKVHVIITAHWNGKTFYNEDWEECRTIEYKNQVRYFFEIEKPKEKK